MFNILIVVLSCGVMAVYVCQNSFKYTLTTGDGIVTHIICYVSIILIFKKKLKQKNDAEMVKINGWLKINRT